MVHKGQLPTHTEGVARRRSRPTKVIDLHEKMTAGPFIRSVYQSIIALSSIRAITPFIPFHDTHLFLPRYLNACLVTLLKETTARARNLCNHLRVGNDTPLNPQSTPIGPTAGRRKVRNVRPRSLKVQHEHCSMALLLLSGNRVRTAAL